MRVLDDPSCCNVKGGDKEIDIILQYYNLQPPHIIHTAEMYSLAAILAQ